MTDSVQQAWVIPEDPEDLAPLPALKLGECSVPSSYQCVDVEVFDRRQKTFCGPVAFRLDTIYDTFEECRAAMIDARIEALDQARAVARSLANSVEHIRTIPTATFPNVVREVPEAQQQQQEAEGQEEAKAEEVKPATKPLLKRPSRKGNG